MIKTRPLADDAEKSELVSEYGLDVGQKYDALELWDGDNKTGYIFMTIKGDTVYFEKFILTAEYSDMEKHFFLDFLMRSAASYAENRGIENMVSHDADMREFLLKKGFKEENDAVCAPISLIVHYN